MGFEFSLATLLRLREIAEEREERLLGQILKQMAQTRQTMADLRVKHIEVRQGREKALMGQISAAELQISYGQMRGLEEDVKLAQEQLIKLEGLRFEQVKAYESAHRAKELLAGMREEQLEVFRDQRTKQEQSAMDDNFNSRRVRL